MTKSDPEPAPIAASDRLLLSLARSSLRDRDRFAFDALFAVVDWPAFADMAIRHRLAPLVLRNLHSLSPCPLPRDVFLTLWSHAQTVARRNASMRDELLRVLDLMRDIGVKAVAYKGPTLAVRALGNLDLREFGDLDVLLRAEDVFHASRLLADDGYAPRYKISEADETNFTRAKRQYDLELYNESLDILIELHWRTDRQFAPESMADDGWWRNLETVRLGDHDVATLPHRELFFALCIHGLKHDWERLSWLVDIAELSRLLDATDWRWIEERGDALRCRRRLAIGMRLATDLLDAPIPVEVLRGAMQGRIVRRAASRMAGNLFDAATAPPSVLRQQWRELSFYDQLGQRLAHCRDLLFTPNAQDWHAHGGDAPSRIFPFVQRIARLFGKHVLGRKTAPAGDNKARPET